MKNKKLFILLIVLLLIIPAGLISSYPAWGEWELSYYEKVLGFIPEGMKNGFSLKTLIPDYSIEGLNPVVSYYISAFVGIAVIFLSFWFLKQINR